MKRIFILFALCLMSALTYVTCAQETVASYTMSYFNDSPRYSIEKGKPEDGKFNYYIRIAGERSGDKVYMVVGNDDLNSFLETLEAVREKYQSWVEIAKKNKVTDVNKCFPYTFKNIQYAWYSSEWQLSGCYDVTPRFLILNSGRMLVVMSNKVCSFKSSYINIETYIVFSSVEEIDELIIKLDNRPAYDLFK